MKTEEGRMQRQGFMALRITMTVAPACPVDKAWLSAPSLASLWYHLYPSTHSYSVFLTPLSHLVWDAVVNCSFCMVFYILLGTYFQMVKLEELSQNKGTCFGKILCCFNCCVIWFKNVFSCPLVFFFFFLRVCAFHNLQPKPIAHKHMGKIGLSGAWGGECPVSQLQGSSCQTCTTPLQPVFKGL